MLWVILKDNKEVMSIKFVNKMFYISRRYIGFLVSLLGLLLILIAGILWIFTPHYYTVLELSCELINNPLHK